MAEFRKSSFCGCFIFNMLIKTFFFDLEAARLGVCRKLFVLKIGKPTNQSPASKTTIIRPQTLPLKVLPILTFCAFPHPSLEDLICLGTAGDWSIHDETFDLSSASLVISHCSKLSDQNFQKWCWLLCVMLSGTHWGGTNRPNITNWRGVRDSCTCSYIRIGLRAQTPTVGRRGNANKIPMMEVPKPFSSFLPISFIFIFYTIYFYIWLVFFSWTVFLLLFLFLSVFLITSWPFLLPSVRRTTPWYCSRRPSRQTSKEVF